MGLKKFSISLVYHFLTGFSLLSSASRVRAELPDQLEQSVRAPLVWKILDEGLSCAEYRVSEGGLQVSSTVVLLRFDPGLHAIEVVDTRQMKLRHHKAEDVANSLGFSAIINSNFFGKSGEPLGLIISGGEILNPLQKGGRVLTGVFGLAKGKLVISHRLSASDFDFTQATQSGPRLIENGKPLKLSAPLILSRRSGVAITKEGFGLFFATTHRFPGASLAQVQRMLLDSRLAVVDALNFDGGGSSQFFIKPQGELNHPINIWGGDEVPALVGLRRVKK